MDDPQSLAVGPLAALPGVRAVGLVPVDVALDHPPDLPVVVVNGAVPGPRVAASPRSR